MIDDDPEQRVARKKEEENLFAPLRFPFERYVTRVWLRIIFAAFSILREFHLKPNKSEEKRKWSYSGENLHFETSLARAFPLPTKDRFSDRA